MFTVQENNPIIEKLLRHLNETLHPHPEIHTSSLNTENFAFQLIKIQNFKAFPDIAQSVMALFNPKLELLLRSMLEIRVIIYRSPASEYIYL